MDPFKAVGSHSTATDDGAWDGPAAEAALPSPLPVGTAREAYAWIDDTAVDAGEVPKTACKFIHHDVSDGSPGAANVKACQTGIGVLHGGRGGADIPTADRQGVYDHLAKHLRDAGLEPPPLEVVMRTLTPVTFAAGPPVTGGGYDAIDMANGTPWAGVLAVEGIETGDQREFVDNSLTWADPPLALRWNRVDSHGGTPMTQAVLVGRIDQVWRDPQRPNYIMGRGVFADQSDFGAEALGLVQGGFLSGISIDPDSITDADVELVFPDSPPEDQFPDAGLPDGVELMPMPELTRFHAGRIRAATLTDVPAFTEARIWLLDSPTSPNPTGPGAAPAAAAARAEVEHFAVPSDEPWNGPGTEANLVAAGLTAGAARRAYAHVSPGTSGTISARFLHHHVAPGGQIGPANLRAVRAGLAAIEDGRADALPDDERRAAHAHLRQHLAAAAEAAPEYVSAVTLVASGEYAHLLNPPAEWFADQHLRTLTPLTVTDEGQVYGHGAAWGTCHTGYAGTCVTPPHEPAADHAYYRVGEVVCADGSRVAVGHLTLGTGHAAVRGLTPQLAAEHYDHTGTVVALVASGEDQHGIWVAGALAPDITPERVGALRAAALSGDWRRIGGRLRLVAFLAVNVPGFPIPRTSAFTQRAEQRSLVAAGVVTQDQRRVGLDADVARRTVARIAASIGRTPAARLAEQRARVDRARG